MGYVVLGLGVWTLAAGNLYEGDYWKMGMNGAMFQMIAHGLSSAGMFFLVGVVYDRVHHRDLNRFGGLFAKMPLYSGLSFGIFFAAMGLPGLCGFIGEFLVVLSAWGYSKAMAVVAASVVILTAGYILWTLQRVYLGPQYKGPRGEALKPITQRESIIAAALLVFAVLFGVYPKAVFDYMEPSVSKTVDDLRTWQMSSEKAQASQAPSPPQQAARLWSPHQAADTAAAGPRLAAARNPAEDAGDAAERASHDGWLGSSAASPQQSETVRLSLLRQGHPAAYRQKDQHP
jgi:NADH-quinone oxidoreductase subunit M